ncbi:MAG: L,D-transpeptidase family protein [Oceanicaulis sp.]
MRIAAPLAALIFAILIVLACAGMAAAQNRVWSAPWSDGEIADLGDALSEAWTHGLDPADYADPRALAAMARGRERDEAARAAWFEYAEDLAFGRVDPRQLDPDWTTPVRDQDLMVWYARARDGLGIFESLEALSPQHPDYQALRAALISLGAAPDAPGPIAPGPALGRGDQGPRVDAVRARLHELGLLADPGRPGAAFDAALESALMRFQARRNLAADGRAGSTTIAELNAGADHRAGQLRANLERWRWLPADLGERHIRVNIADYRLEAWAGGRVERVHETQIGKTYASTPVFSDSMSIVEIHPWWYTPGGLGSRWVRTFRSNPAYAYSQGYHLVDLDTGERVNAYTVNWAGRRFRVIQQPGPNNAMGEVKFLFPNRHNVYIHDTPHRDGFALSRRDDSAGCVRVGDPHELAIWVLQGEGWSPAQVRAVFDAGDTRRVRLDNEIPVHILYFTAVTGRMGDVRFIFDVYERDSRLIDALDGFMGGVGDTITPPAPAREEAGAGAL